MLAEALIALAGAAGSALVTAMTTDAWEGVKTRCARLLGRGDADAEARQEGRLEQSRQELLAADDRERAGREQEAAWAARLRDLLEDHPDSEGQLRELVDSVAGHASASVVQVNAQARDQAQQAVQGQGVQNVTFGPRQA
ncbi:hypothetical protein ETD86_05035 [Nonomuraea turkmeniaca]|uniref:Uncharacterized protein n=1 Tax=Nonomuraea turkmeniaca TaxID=103838 RepID=A0A5S4FU24_9ACTN|nr:hypothetical protein [Nonomuraea turkmeniaca]TMR24277.1 hypothetical protein ETD86_05035 [Nonomuraea turkmeniaca]